MSGLVSHLREGEIGVITLSNPPVNALGPALLTEIRQALEELRGEDGVRGVVLIGGGRAFSGGVDINEFGKVTSGHVRRDDLPFPALLEALEQFPKPVVCAIHGFAFVGGLELAMACHYRVADQTAQVGQPEVKLGIIPGAGGTQRLPRLAGALRAGGDVCDR
jgi:3-hydroxyacyl-CoA dehydrogenase